MEMVDRTTMPIRDLQGNDLLIGNRGSDLYTISLQKSNTLTPIYLTAKASSNQAWLWHRRLSYLNFDYINLLSKKDVVIGFPKLKYVKDQLCSYCEVSKAKRSSFRTKTVPSSKGQLHLLHMDLCGPMRVASINGKKGTEFLNKTLHAFFKEEGIENQTSTPRTTEQNSIVERRNRTLVEAARTMLSASKLPLFFWAEAIETACDTQNRSIIILNHDKMAYHIINGRKPLIKHLYIFGCTCYLTRDGENLNKIKEKRDSCILVGYSTQSKGYRVYNERTRLIVESIHLKFDEIKEMSETSVANDTSGLVPQRQKASDYDNSDPVPQIQNVLPLADTTSSSPIDNSQQRDTPPTMNIQSLTEPTNPTNANAKENTDNQAENEQLQEHEFTNPFCTSVQEVFESYSHNIVEPKNTKEAMADSTWINAMQEELHQFDRLEVWELIDKPFGKNEEGVDFEESFAPVARLEAVRIFRKFTDSGKLYWIETSSKSMYDELSQFLMSKGFNKGLQIHQSLQGIFVNHAKYALEILKNIGMEKGQSIGTPMATKPKLDADFSGKLVDQTDYRRKISFDLTAFSDADHAGCIDTRKSTYRGIQFVGDKLVSWMSKKQDCTTMSSVEAEYMALSASCAQVMWMRK
nr:hypothetical protein [Tanacetum cinerariifolium]